jgi:hypothetical protein
MFKTSKIWKTTERTANFAADTLNITGATLRVACNLVGVAVEFPFKLTAAVARKGANYASSKYEKAHEAEENYLNELSKDIDDLADAIANGEAINFSINKDNPTEPEPVV